MGKKKHHRTNLTSTLVLIAEFRTGFAGLNLGYPEIQLLNPENPAKLGSLIFPYVDLSWLAGFEKIKLDFQII